MGVAGHQEIEYLILGKARAQVVEIAYRDGGSPQPLSAPRQPGVALRLADAEPRGLPGGEQADDQVSSRWRDTVL